MKTFLIIIFGIFITASCSNKKKDSVASLKEEVMALHDEVMPKMGELHKTQKQLLTLADSAGGGSLAAQKYRELAETIELANESMMDWMRNYEPNYAGTEQEIREYLEGQKTSISRVKEDMLKSLEAGKDALANPIRSDS